MSKLLIVLLVIIFSSTLSINENADTKLSGTPISSDTSSKTMQYAFDGNLSTEFKSSKASYGWVGLKLDSSYRITKIGWAMKSSTNKANYLLGVFEGSNDSTFVESVPIHMITEEVKTGTMIYATIEVTSSFQYIRYVGPNAKYCVIAEFEVYGTQALSNEEYWYQPTNIPLVAIHTVNAVEPKDKVNYVTCNILIVSKNKKNVRESASIRLRGNATMRLDKKPYKVKFDSKVQPVDLPAKAKKWTLLPNHSDKTLIRNSLSYYISNLFDMTYTPSCTMVDVIFNGEFKGNYGLCDFLEKASDRVVVDDMDDQCNEEPCVTGGYFFAADAYAQQEGYYYKTNRGILYTIHYPDEDSITRQQTSYLTNYFNTVEEEGYGQVVDRIDIDSFCKYLLIEDLCGNGEAYWSAYMTKLRYDDKFYFGPVWDMDLAFDNDQRVYSTLNKNDFIYKYGTSAGTMNTFVTKVLANTKVLQSLKSIWADYTKTKVTKQVLVNFINDLISEIDESQKLNFIRWDILNTKILLNPVARGSYKAETDYLREYIQKRFDIVTTIVNKATTESISAEVERNHSNLRNKRDDEKL